MKTFPLFLAGSLLFGPTDAGPPPLGPARDSLVLTDGQRTPGRLVLGADGVLGFRAEGADRPTPLETGAGVLSTAPAVTLPGLPPPFRADLGRGQQLFGRLVALEEGTLRLLDADGATALAVARPGLNALIQRPGESQVVQDGFETLDTKRWTVVGEPDLVAGPRLTGEHALRLPAGGASLTFRVPEPFASGRLELAFHDTAEVVAGQQWWADLTFRNAGVTETLRVLFGWADDSLGVESPGGPALAVQRLPRKAGWHRLVCRFGPDRCEVGVDGNELAVGKGLHAPLAELRLATYQVGKAEAPKGLAAHADDLRLVRLEEPHGGPEVDASQDEARLSSGDQLFGSVVSASADSVRLKVDGHALTLGWGEVAGLGFRRAPARGATLSGPLVRVEWQGGPGDAPRERNVMEGALTGLTPASLTLATAYAGTFAIDRERLRALTVLGRGTRIEIDPKAHHLGNEVSAVDPVLDPPQSEGAVLERTVELAEVPETPASLVLDVVQVVGEANDLPFALLVRKGELRTNLKLNGMPFDYLNRHITSRNETPERVRLPIPRGLLRAGKNTVRFEQVGTAGDPNYLDDLGILGIALEFEPTPRP